MYQEKAEKLFEARPIQNELVEFQYDGFDYKFTVNRLDQVSDDASGNKFFKLKYNVFSAIQHGRDTLLTFGGAWSNHIQATAEICGKIGLKSIGVIRGEAPKVWSDTLRKAEKNGMNLHFISREEYREKEEDYFKAWLRDSFGSFHLIPEGGSNFFGVQGCMEIPNGFPSEVSSVFLAAGTGATSAGILLGGTSKVHVVSALKGGEFLREDIRSQIYWSTVSDEITEEMLEKLQLVSDMHFGGYAKYTEELIQLLKEFYRQTGIKMEPIYSGKALAALLRSIQLREVKNDGTAVLIHTGGLQGITGIEQKLKENLF